jgi:hypothetical protein
MGAYNILKTEIQCTHCKKTFIGKVQFKFGDTWQYEYLIGETIKWGAANIGHPDIDNVKVYGILENLNCPVCESPLECEYDIIIKEHTIISIVSLVDFEDYNTGDGNYCLLNGNT